MVEEERTCRTVGMRQQGAYIRWENAIARKVTWAELWKAEPQRIKFLIQVVYDVVPSPSNLHIWGKVESPACPLCSRRGTLEHILSCCPKALGEGKYRWRHDQVLKAIAEALLQESSGPSAPAPPSSKPSPSLELESSQDQLQKHLQASWPLRGTGRCWWTWSTNSSSPTTL